MNTGRLSHELFALIKTDDPAELGPKPRSGTLPIAEIDGALKGFFATREMSGAAQDLFRAAIYLWHDHLDAAHRIAQEIETADGSLIHGIMHRREPDYPNAKYWFRRGGAHPSFLALATRAEESLRSEDDLRSRLIPNRTWDPFAFVDVVEDSCDGEFSSRIPLLREIQQIEMECLVENLARRAQ